MENSKKRTVLVAVDESKHSRLAFSWYVNNVRQERDMIILVHAIPQPIGSLETAGYPFSWYVNNVRQERDLIILVHAIRQPTGSLVFFETAGYPFPYECYDLVAQMDRATDLESKCILESYSQNCQRLKFDFKVVSDIGKPGQVICKAARTQHADLIVMGSRGHCKLRRALMGSTSSYCFDHAHVPLIVVPCSHGS